jgi:endonuclease YncB( thermonuclease family)
MAIGKALWAANGGLKMGASKLGFHGEHTGSIKQNVHDGDTTNVRLDRNLGVRFLGIDTPEISFEFPGTSNFVALSNEKWDTLFTSGAWKEGLVLYSGLLADLESRIGDGTGVAKNHAVLADAAQKSLESIIESDFQISGKTKEEFQHFMAFAHEFLDSYGRLLCYLNSSEENYSHLDPNVAKAIKRWSYNERQLMTGWAVPYFIWPNLQPFMNHRPFTEENVRPDGFWKLIKGASKLKSARDAVASARQQKIGIFDAADPLRVMPFELRFLSRKKGPERYVINMADEGSTYLLDPSLYYTIPNAEDRLHIPPEYLPIFKAYGWNVTGLDAATFLTVK